jgi:hypothetical protein
MYFVLEAAHCSGVMKVLNRIETANLQAEI